MKFWRDPARPGLAEQRAVGHGKAHNRAVRACVNAHQIHQRGIALAYLGKPRTAAFRRWIKNERIRSFPAALSGVRQHRPNSRGRAMRRGARRCNARLSKARPSRRPQRTSSLHQIPASRCDARPCTASRGKARSIGARGAQSPHLQTRETVKRITRERELWRGLASQCYAGPGLARMPKGANERESYGKTSINGGRGSGHAGNDSHEVRRHAADSSAQ